MKKIIFIIFILLAFFGCRIKDDDNPVINPPELIPPQELPPNPVLFTLYDGYNFMYYDGNTTFMAYQSPNIKFAGRGVHSISDVLYHFDQYGNPILAEWLLKEPDAIAVIQDTPFVVNKSGFLSKASTVYEDETWLLEDIPPAEALAMGAQYKHYTRVYENLVEVGNWIYNDWQVDYVIIPLSGDVIAIDTMSSYHNLSGPEIIHYAKQDGLMVHTMDIVAKTGKIKTDTGDYDVSWTYNFFINAKWEQSGGTWFSYNGYTFDIINGLLENVNALWDWNSYPFPVQEIYGENPVVLPAGHRIENSLDVLYMIECNSGTLTRYRPGVDIIDILPQIYVADGTRLTGIYHSQNLQPEIIDEYLYFHEGGSIKRYNFSTQIIDVFFGDMELAVWQQP